MASQTPKPLSTPPPQTSKVAATPAANTPSSPAAGATAPTPADLQKKKILMVAGGALIFLAAIGTVPFLILGSSRKTSKALPPTPTASVTPKPSVDTSSARELISRVFVKDGANRLPYDLSFTPPQAWNSRYSTTTATTYPWTSSILITSILSGYSPLSASNLNAPSSNYLALMDVTDWLQNDQNAVPLKVAQKQDWRAKVSAITAASLGNAAAITNPGLKSETGSRQLLTYVQSQDGTMHGFSYVVQTNAGHYEPAMIVMMIGTLKDRSVVLYGQHALRDQAWSELSGLLASTDPSYAGRRDAILMDFAAGKSAADTVSIEAEFVKTLGTLKITPAG